MNCNEVRPLIHEYLDGDLESTEADDLQNHIQDCRPCGKLLKQMEYTEALIKVFPTCKAPRGLTDRILEDIPLSKRRNVWVQWVRRHPAVAASVFFLVVMVSAYMSLWNQDKELMVKGSDLSQVIIKGHTVYVPSSHVVAGNLMVKNGEIEVDGAVKGNLVVVDGSVQMASTAQISGQITKVNQALDWLWYNINTFFTSISK